MSKYNRRHYEDFAYLLSKTDDTQLVDRFVHFFVDDNPRFDSVKFRFVVSRYKAGTGYVKELIENYDQI
jgi:hypothetical protein